uniref:Uncharacterized protein n=1 Tax=Tetradesmus obliquus TaxID=3088 RepID=A0A383V7J3_TETOB|eukprot:jgi/Sobl393_1/17988/SZX73031.1
MITKQLSQDMMDCVLSRSQRTARFPRCDSSDCLVCQGQRTFCSEAVTSHVSCWLERRMSATNSSLGDSLSASVPSDDASVPVQQQRKRIRREGSQDSAEQQQEQEQQQQAALLPAPSHPDASASQQQEGVFFSSLLGCQPWAWRPEWADWQQPAPCRMVQLASLQSPAELSSGVAGQQVRRGDMICGLEFSLDGQMLATAGVSKQVALYALAALEQQQEQQQPEASYSSRRQQQQQQDRLPSLPPVALVRLPGKVSSIAWSPDMDGVMSIGDYDGTLTQVHVASGHYLSEVDAHCGRRIWSVAHSRLRPHLAATASDDCTAKLWAGSAVDSPVATISLPGSPAVCCADFSQHDANLLALAAADARVYLYDLRQLAQPLAVLRGHSRPVSYAKFFGGQQLVSASIDGTLAAWDLLPVLGQAVSSSSGSGTGHSSSSSSASAYPGTSSRWRAGEQHQQQQQLSQPWKVFKGHTNEKNFVGLAVQPSAGLMAVGSETGEVFAYHTSWSDPLARHRLDAAAQQQQQCVQQLTKPAALGWSQQLQQRSACAVAWQPSAPSCGSSGGADCFRSSALLAAANSAGECRLLALVDP